MRPLRQDVGKVERTCSFSSCVNRVETRGLCQSHYKQELQGLSLSPLRQHGRGLSGAELRRVQRLKGELKRAQFNLDAYITYVVNEGLGSQASVAEVLGVTQQSVSKRVAKMNKYNNELLRKGTN